MRLLRVLTMGLSGTLCAALLLGAGAADAQTRTLRNTQAPAELPPASFDAPQYVDSRGCVFIRVGVGGATRWVPRVNRDRSVVCGQAPSARPSAVAAAPVAEPAPAPVATAAAPAPTPTVTATEPVIRRTPAVAAPREIAAPAPARVAPAPAPARVAAPVRPRTAPRPAPPAVVAPRATALAIPPGCGATELSARYLRNTPACAAALAGRAGSAPAARAVAAPTVATQPAQPRRTVRRAGAPVPVVVTPPASAVRVNPAAPSPRRARGQVVVPATTGCTGATELSTRYLRGATRCGSGARDSSSLEVAPGVTTASTRGQRVVIVPAARTTFDVSHPPAGYRAAFDDGRLNPARGPRTLEGDYQSQAIWTNETPRRLRSVIYVTR
ncbi:hypothetical protein ACK8OR_01130 [Jannaschia sp. KMU-145]|uniref:hypothetical protein n=1 Tax=Jannaschia halovivens TaxID=3388667 RepID=UPI00396AFBB9